MDLYKNSEMKVLASTSVAGTSDVTSDEVDMQGAESVLFLVKFGAITSGAATSVKLQQDIVTGMGSAADLLGTSVTVLDTDDDKVVPVMLIKPRERFVRCVVVKATQNSVVECILAIKFGCKKVPPTHDATTVHAGETHTSPAEGTA